MGGDRDGGDFEYDAASGQDFYANEGIAQGSFFQSDEACRTSYKDKKGKYQAQVEVTLPRI